MKSARLYALIILALAFFFNEWAFRFIFPLEPIDSFLRLMTLVLDCFVAVFGAVFLAKSQPFSKRVKHLLTTHPKPVSIYLGLLLSFCLLMAVEFSCRFYFKHVYQAPYSEKTFWEPSAVVSDPVLGSALLKDTTISHAYVVNDSLIYKQDYRTDEFGRRTNPMTKADSAYGHFAMITGCSFAFGYGLNQYQTLSYYVDSLTNYRAYNYGVSGHGTQQTLALLQNRNLDNEIDEKNGVLIHLFIDDHLARLIGSRRLIKLWAENYPYYYLDKDNIVRNGSFMSGRPILSRFYKAISQSAFIDLFDVDFPWYTSKSHLALFSAILEKAQVEFTKQYPQGRFLVVIGPNSKLAPRVTQALSEKGVEFLDLSELLDKENPKYKIHWTEGHPNHNYYLEIANAIDAHLSTHMNNP